MIYSLLLKKQSMNNLAKKRKPEKIPLKVVKGGLIPADAYAEQRLREKKYRVGDILAAVLTKSRSYGTHKHAHNIATVCLKNIPEFSGYANAHEVLKRLQIESGSACDEIGVRIEGVWSSYRVPRSFSYDSMDEGDFNEAVKVICRYISSEYWPDMEPWQIEVMADLMVWE